MRKAHVMRSRRIPTLSTAPRGLEAFSRAGAPPLSRSLRQCRDFDFALFPLTQSSRARIVLCAKRKEQPRSKDSYTVRGGEGECIRPVFTIHALGKPRRIPPEIHLDVPVLGKWRQSGTLLVGFPLTTRVTGIYSNCFSRGRDFLRSPSPELDHGAGRTSPGFHRSPPRENSDS